jgi:23S rRNA (guanosine2251-2'-O)-methyltransferase
MSRPPASRRFHAVRPPQPASRHASASRAAHAIYGLHAVLAALRNPRRKLRQAFVTPNALAAVAEALGARGLTPQTVTPRDLDARLGGGAVHQGVLLEAEPLEQPDLGALLDSLSTEPHATLAVLDQITDPHNVGAILRSAAAFSVRAIIMQARHSPPLSGVLAKAASGALEHVAVLEEVNLARTLEELKQAGFFCAGFDSDGPETPERALGAPKIALVFGAEDKGLRRLVREACDAICALPVTGAIRSLNVSNAAAIAFHERARQQSGHHL